MMELIYNQREIPKEQWRYGLRSSAATGCGWIATYNALCLLGYRAKPEELIRYYTWQLPLLHGNTGTSFWGPALRFRQWGFPVEMTASRGQFDAVANRSNVCIVFYHWRSQWKLGAHFVTVHQKDGRFVGYNTFRNSKGPDNWGDSIEGFLTGHGFFGAVLIGIRDKRKNEP